MAQNKWNILMKLAQTMGAELDAFAMKWDQHQNKDQFVRSIGKYSTLKWDNRELYDKIKRRLYLSDECLNDLMYYIIQNHPASDNSASNSTNADRVTAMADLIMEQYFQVSDTVLTSFLDLQWCS